MACCQISKPPAWWGSAWVPAWLTFLLPVWALGKNCSCWTPGNIHQREVEEAVS